MLCNRVLVPTPEGNMKVINKESPEYREVQRLEFKAWENERLDRIPSSFDEVSRRWGSFPNYFKWLKKVEDDERQKTHYLHLMPKWKRNRILNVEKALLYYKKTGDFNRLYKKLKHRVDYWAGYYGKNYSSFWLSREDFEEVFWLTVKQAADRVYISTFNDDSLFGHLANLNGYVDAGSDIYFYVAINKKLRDRGTDVLRAKLGTKQGHFEHNLQRLPDHDIVDQTADVEKVVTDKMIVHQIINNQTLTDDEKRFLKVLYLNAGASFQELADLRGLKHRETARRMLLKIQKKLTTANIRYDNCI